MSVELKIKSKHLALEPAIIRKEERKLRKRVNHYRQHHQIASVSILDWYQNHPDLYKLHEKETSLRNHRKWDVCNEARATYLARAYIKGISYRSVEHKSEFNDTFKRFILPRVFDMIAKYGKPQINKHWNRDEKKWDYKPEQKEILMSQIKLWFGIE